MRKSIKTKTYISINYTLHVIQDGVFNTHTYAFPSLPYLTLEIQTWKLA